MRSALGATRVALLASLCAVVALWASPGAARADEFDARWDTAHVRLRVMHEALMAFVGQYGEFAESLSELYFDDPSNLIDPFAAPARDSGFGDLLPTSVGYRLTRASRWAGAMEVEDVGEHYPVLRAGRQRGIGVLNMTLAGHVYFSPVDWKPLGVLLGEDHPDVTAEDVANALDQPPPPPGYTAPPWLTQSLNELCAALANSHGDVAARHHAEGILRAWNHDDAGAVRALSRAVERAPSDADMAYHYGNALERLVGRRADAIGAYERVLAIEDGDTPPWRGAHRRLSTLYAKVGAAEKHDDLVAAFAPHVTSDTPRLQARLTRMHVDAGRHAAAIEVGERFLDSDGSTENRALAAALADATSAQGAAEAAERYRILAHPALGLVGSKPDGVPRASGTKRNTPVLVSISRGDGGADREARAALLDTLRRERWQDGLMVVSTTTERKQTADPWWRDIQKTGGHVVLYRREAVYDNYGVEGSVTILIDADGYASYVSDAPQRDAPRLREAVAASLAAYKEPHVHGVFRVNGTARDDANEPVDNATVGLYYYDNLQTENRLIATAITDAAGSFSLATPAVPFGDAIPGSRRYHIFAQAAGQAVWMQGISPAYSRAGSVRIRLSQPRVVRGRVVDGAGTPAAGVRIAVRSVTGVPKAQTRSGRASSSGYHTPRPSGPLDCITDEDGRYAFEALPDECMIFLHTRHADYADAYAWVATHKQTEVDIVVSAGATIEGSVTFADLLSAPNREDAIAAGVTVRVKQVVPPALEAAYGDAEWQTPLPTGYGTSVETDSRGRYRIDRVPPGYVDVYATAPGHTSKAWQAYRVAEGESHTADIYLIPGGIVDGVVLNDDTGEPVGPDYRARVRMSGPGGAQSAWLGEDGRFQFRTAPGANYLSITAPTGWETLDTPDRPQPKIVGVIEGETTGVMIRVRRLDEWPLTPGELTR